jgi:hypothetical protein
MLNNEQLKHQMASDVAYLNKWIIDNRIRKGDFESVRNHYIVMRAVFGYQMRLGWLNELKEKITYAK